MAEILGPGGPEIPDPLDPRTRVPGPEAAAPDPDEGITEEIPRVGPGARAEAGRPEQAEVTEEELKTARDEYVLSRLSKTSWLRRETDEKMAEIAVKYAETVMRYALEEGEKKRTEEIANLSEEEREALNPEIEAKMLSSLILSIQLEEQVVLNNTEVELKDEQESNEWHNKGLFKLMKEHPYITGFLIGGMYGPLAVLGYKGVRKLMGAKGKERPEFVYERQLETDGGEVNLEEALDQMAKIQEYSINMGEKIGDDPEMADLYEKIQKIYKKGIEARVDQLREDEEMTEENIQFEILKEFTNWIVKKEALADSRQPLRKWLKKMISNITIGKIREGD